jgi:hypothetical protein
VNKNYAGKKTARLTMADDRPDWRPCLGPPCNRKLFWSMGPGNRHCPRCDAVRLKKVATSSKQQLGTVRDTRAGK